MLKDKMWIRLQIHASKLTFIKFPVTEMQIH